MTFSKIFIAASAVLMLTACGGGESQSEAVMSENKIADPITKGKGGTTEAKFLDAYLSGMNDMADALESIDDEASAKKAAEQIAKIASGMEAMVENHGDSLNDKKAAMALMTGGRRGEFMKAQARVQTGMMKLVTQHPEYMEIISKEMEKMPTPGRH